MNKKLLHTLGNALQPRLAEELDWLNADPGRESLIVLLQELAAKMRSARIVVSPGYSFLTDSYLLFLTGVTRVNPVEWNLPFSRFIMSVHDGAEIPFEAGTGCLEVARRVLSGRENEMVIETEPGLFEISFLDGIELMNVKLRIITYAELDRFPRTIKEGWNPLDEATLKLFRRGATDGSIWFETDKIREWLFDFDPESMADLCLLNAIYHPDRISLYDTILQKKQNPDSIPSTGNPSADQIVASTYGTLVYQEQALRLNAAGYPVGQTMKSLAHQGHTIARTMISVEAVARNK